MSWVAILSAILGLAVLMVVHEGGHHLVARAFGMRVIRFSIGFGPALWRYQPRGSSTVYQIALIPFLAYVQIDGMNPFEEVDPDDAGSYANASLTGRIATVVAGPMANYFFASILFFAAYMLGGKLVPSQSIESTKVEIIAGGAAEAAKMNDGDQIVSVKAPSDKSARRIKHFDDIRKVVVANPSKPLEVVVRRDGLERTLIVTPEPKGDKGSGLIGVRPEKVPMTIQEAALRSVIDPPAVVAGLVIGLAQIATGKVKPDLAGPVGIVKMTGERAMIGLDEFLKFLAILSAYLGGFNLLPVPALDGGRLVFLGYEAVTRRRADAKVEAHVHALGLLMLLTLIAVVTVFDIRGN